MKYKKKVRTLLQRLELSSTFDAMELSEAM